MIPDHVMNELRYVEMYAAKKIHSLRAGAHASRLRGSGFDFQDLRPGRRVEKAHRIVRQSVPHLAKDRYLAKDIQTAEHLISSAQFEPAIKGLASF